MTRAGLVDSAAGRATVGVRLPAHTPHAVQSNDEVQFGKLVMKIEFQALGLDGGD